MNAAPPPRLPRRASSFQPRFTLSLVYLAGFFLLYALLFVAPELWRVLASMPPGPEQQEVAQRVAREAVRTRLGVVLAAAVATTGLAIYLRVLPGMRAPLRP